HGGIAQFNRDLLKALCAYPDMEEVVALPRLVLNAPEAMPANLTFVVDAGGGLPAYLKATGRYVLQGGYDGVICGHLHLMPLALLAARLRRVPVLLILHGLEARQPSAHPSANWLARYADAHVAVSNFTKTRFEAWSAADPARGHVIPNCIDLKRFTPGPRPQCLRERYGLSEGPVLLTLSRLPTQELGKGHDEVLEALPALLETHSTLTYVIAGTGPDADRLQAKAGNLGIADHVVFTGYVPEAEKIDHYRMADAFVMPGRTEGFGIVYLEALACGIPVVASSADASAEAVRDGALGEVVNPDDPEDVQRGIHTALQKPRGVPEGLAYFSTARFKERWHRVVDHYIAHASEEHVPDPPALVTE
ncbi:MAG: glycosyltransferase family 4 protein, partial [Spiribacter salinus]